MPVSDVPARTGGRPASGQGLRLNLGCGLHAPENWVNIDGSPGVLISRTWVGSLLEKVRGEAHPKVEWPQNVVYGNLTRPLRFPDGAARQIYSSHTLEHLYFNEAIELLKECRRVLRPGGQIRLALPDAEAEARRLLDDVKRNSRSYNQALLSHPDDRPRGVRKLIALASNSAHKWQPTASLVEEMLLGVGFREVRRYEFRDGPFEGLFEVENRPESFFLQATKP